MKTSDDDASSKDVTVAKEESLVYEIDPAKEKKLVRKLDLTIMPIFALLYFLSFLDRANIGNAAVAGMKTTLALNTVQYSAAVSGFYATYILAEIPSLLVVKRLKPHNYMAFLVAAWSLVTIFSGFMKSFWSLLLTRLLLGLFEGGFFPCQSLYISMTYKREEQATRQAYLYICSCFSGAFGGMIAIGLTEIPQGGSMPGWSWLYIIEGVVSICGAFLVYFGLPDDPTTAKFFNDEEKELMAIRARQRQEYMGSATFEWRQVFITFKDPKVYLSAVIQFCTDIVLYGFTTFLPSILELELGNTALQAQYLSVPVYVASAIAMGTIAYFSDRTLVRFPFMIAMNLVGMVGYIILLASSNSGANYFATYLIALPLYATTGLNITWLNNNMAPHYRRATALGFNQSLGNLAGVIAGQVYRTSPYKLGNGFSLGCMVVGTLCTVFMSLYLRSQNRQKDAILNGTRKDHMAEREGCDGLTFKYIF
ncbi:nicotinic acid plasma membrane transporter [Umbelopsis sp. PMI_123]|nr:nicotinic acid plasma membrane transporter [Umbelopsis sp. PMI_123]